MGADSATWDASPGGREPIDRGSARISEAEQLRHLVEGLARGVVTGRTELDDRVRAGGVHPIDGGVSARGEQADERESRRRRVLLTAAQEHGEQVPHEVIDAHERLAGRPCEALRGLNADEQRADEPGTIRHRHAVHVRQPHPGLRERRADDGAHVAQVISRRQLRDNAPVGSVHAHLRVDDVTEDAAVPVHERRAGLVARRLDP